MTETPIDPATKICGICESIKTETNDVMVCDHCDVPCPRGKACTICRQGMKGLEEIE